MTYRENTDYFTA